MKIPQKVSKASFSKPIKISAALIVICSVALLFIYTVKVQPFKAFGGAAWLNGGIHYLSSSQVAERIEKINAPKEAKLVQSIEASTPSCESIDSGFCARNKGDYVDKTLVTAAVEYKPGTPDTKQITGYCTLCNDGTFSPSCAVGRGACSYHNGVAQYNVASYRTVPGTTEVPAEPAVYSYGQKTYRDSSSYIAPDQPSLKEIVHAMQR